MTKHRALVYGATIPQDWLDGIQEFISTYISDTAVVTVLNSNTVQIAAAADNGQVCIGLSGRWRWITSAVNAVHPGGTAGTYNLWATAADNSFTIGPPEIDNTIYTFSIAILAVGSTPATALYRQIGTVQWNGTKVTDANLLGDDPATRGSMMPGDLIFSAAATRPGALLADGSAVSRTTYAALFNLIGTTYGAGDGSTTFNLPDYRGRVIVGVGTGTGLTARALAATGGLETVTLSAAQSGVPAHTHPSGSTLTGTTATGSTGTGSTGTGSTGTGVVSPASNPVNTGGASARHTHPNGLASAGVAIDAPAGTTYGQVQVGSTGNDTPDHSHSVTLPTLNIPALSVPALSVPALSIPALAVTGTVGAIAAASAAAASANHENMQPWATGYIYIKV